MPVRTWVTRLWDSRRIGGGLPVRHHIGEEAVATLAALGEDLVAAVGTVDPDGGGDDERSATHDLRQTSGGSDAAVVHRSLVRSIEATRNRLSRQVDDSVDSVEQVGRGVVGVPVPLVDAGPGRRPGRGTHEPYDPVATGAQERTEPSR